MKLDREMQLQILNTAREIWPNDVSLHQFGDPKSVDVIGNTLYLIEHGLLRAQANQTLDGSWIIHAIYITKDGLDFLEQDGGLSAILGVVTVKLHDDTIKALIERRIMDSDLQPEEKKKYVDQLRQLPADSTKHLVMKLIDMGLEKGPAAIRAIGTVIGGLQI